MFGAKVVVQNAAGCLGHAELSCAGPSFVQDSGQEKDLGSWRKTHVKYVEKDTDYNMFILT